MLFRSRLPVRFDVPSIIGEMTIDAGDSLFSDRDCVMRISRVRLDDVLRRACQAMNKENPVQNGIMTGVDPQKAYLQH